MCVAKVKGYNIIYLVFIKKDKKKTNCDDSWATEEVCSGVFSRFNILHTNE